LTEVKKWSLQVCVEYAKRVEKTFGKAPIMKFVTSGNEPLEFQKTFFAWTRGKLDLTAEDGCEDIVKVLGGISVKEYAYEDLKGFVKLGKFPEGVEPATIEMYMGDEEFSKIMEMTKTEFTKIPPWKQTDLRKKINLF
jgi:supervillin